MTSSGCIEDKAVSLCQHHMKAEGGLNLCAI